MEKSGEWGPCYADPYRGVAFFDGVLIECDPITETGQDRVLPVLEEEHIFVCRQITPLLERLGTGGRVLDVNTGTGVSAIWAARFGCQVVAVDVRHRALAIASENIKRNEHLLNPENITFELLSSYGELGDKERFSDPFDLIILTLPYTPSYSAIPVATYGNGGEDGQDIFNQVIPHIVGLLKEGGVCVGHQMSPVNRDKNLAVSLSQIQSVFKERCLIKHTPLLNVGRYKTSDFLNNTYKNYLVDISDKNDFAVNEELSDQLHAWIDRISGTYPELEITYFEATKLDYNAGIVNVTGAIARSKKDWEWRIKLHREVVDHTSMGSNVSYTSLFLRSGSALQNIEQRRKNLISQEKKRGMLSFETSLLSTFSDWVTQNDLTAKGSEDDYPLFDFIFVETLPFFNTLSGRRDMQSESKICLSTDICPDEESRLKLNDALLKAWQEVTINLQLARSGMATHEHFVGHDQEGGWSNLTSTMWGAPFKDLTITHKDIYGTDKLKKRLFDDVNDNYEEVLAAEQKSTTDVSEINTDRENGYLAIALNDIEIAEERELQVYWGGIRARIIDAGEAYNSKTLRKDLEVCHAAGHIRYQDAFEQKMEEIGCRKFKWSTKLGIPLSLGPSNIDLGYKLPLGYRGGIWVMAGSSRDWTLEHEAKLLDGIRLLWLLCNGQYNLQAAEKREDFGALEAYVETSSALGHEVKHIIESLSSYWLIKPDRQVYKAVQGVTTAYGDEWAVAPMPMLIESTGRLFKLWARTNNPLDVFGINLPSSMQELVAACWKLAKEALKPYVFSQERPVGKNLEVLREFNQFIDDKLWPVTTSPATMAQMSSDEKNLGRFVINIGDSLPQPPNWRESLSTESQKDKDRRWMHFIRLLMAIFGNCIKHADYRRDIKVTITSESTRNLGELQIQVDDYKDDGSSKDLVSAIQLAMKRVSTTSLSSKMSSTDIIKKLCADYLKGTVSTPDERADGSYTLRCRIPVESLNP